ncbi:SGNH/GDSL hydrolase family protein [Dictyobacter formicarum]|uniref:Lipase n=1 Tax=Dictyobacter formicarum TaxID=2778368 RepID=A0ABQ3VFN4_9CHLR|nr:SGNH/GDSL hydrolase family protein [Dictyobacter formicarum]GHO84727.1 lipase [Dictyobacter formicarum]
MEPLLKQGDTVLFQGDSVTDAGRDYNNPYHLGSGYALMAAAWFQALYPARAVHFLNRGISGHRTIDLTLRWQKDCLDLHPTWVSILIGINDTWRAFDQNDRTPVEAYEANYRQLLDSVKAKLDARLILCEPFALPVPPDRKDWRADLDPKIAVVHKLAQEYGALLIPFDTIFAEAATQWDAAFWAADGVHPSEAGHALMAQHWLRAVQAIA